MRWRLITVVTAALAVLVLGTSPALAKGPDRATLTGPGLTRQVVVSDAGEPGTGGKLADLADGSGLFFALFGPDSFHQGQLIAGRPAGSLGPRYTLVYRVPTGAASAVSVRQDLYPRARGGPVTHTAAGQAGFGDQRTYGGWYVAPKGFAAMLSRLGVPSAATGHRQATQPASDSGPDSILLYVAVGCGVALFVVAGTTLALRRRHHHSLA